MIKMYVAMILFGVGGLIIAVIIPGNQSYLTAPTGAIFGLGAGMLIREYFAN